MKRFDQTYFYQALAPLVYKIIPRHPARDYWCRVLVSFALFGTVRELTAFSQGFLKDFPDYSWQYFGFIGTETVFYSAFLWSFWYGLHQMISFLLGDREILYLTPRMLSCTITGGFLLFLLAQVSQITVDYLLLIRGMLILSFSIGVLLPTVWANQVGQND